MAAVNRASSTRRRGILRGVARCWPSATQARRSEIDSTARTCSMQPRRRAGLSSFPRLPPARSACPESGPRPRNAAECSLSPGPKTLHLVALQPAKLLAPAVIRHLTDPDQTDRIGHALAL